MTHDDNPTAGTPDEPETAMPADDAATEQGTETEQPGVTPRSDDEEDRAAHYA